MLLDAFVSGAVACDLMRQEGGQGGVRSLQRFIELCRGRSNSIGMLAAGARS